MPRKGKKATDTAKTSNTCGKCTVAETEVTVSPQEERNDPPTPPIELVAEHPNFPTMRYQNVLFFFAFSTILYNKPDITLILFAK